MSTRHIVERAFELAEGGGFHTVEELRRALKREGYEAVDAHLAGVAIRKQLIAILAAAPVDAGSP